MNTILAYLGGLLDGDGCIHIARQIPSGAGSNKAVRHDLRLNFTNTCKEIVDLFLNTFGVGTVSPCSKGATHHKQAYQWQASGADARSVLSHVLPYLFTKRAEADIANAFGMLPPAPNCKAGLPDVLIEAREGLYNLLRALKEIPYPIKTALPEDPNLCAAWAAGLIDAEGSFRIRQQSGRYRSPHHWAEIGVAMTCQATVRALVKAVGVFQPARPLGIPKGGTKEVFQVTWTRDKTVQVIEAIQPYLRAKREQADILLSFADIPTAKNCYRGLADEIINRRETHRLELLQLIQGA